MYSVILNDYCVFIAEEQQSSTWQPVLQEYSWRVTCCSDCVALSLVFESIVAHWLKLPVVNLRHHVICSRVHYW